MVSRIRRWPAVSMFAILVACGGGGGGGGVGSTPAPPTGGTPSPTTPAPTTPAPTTPAPTTPAPTTPTPSTPTPTTPTPTTPTPTSNMSLTELTVSQSFPNVAASATASYPADGSAPSVATAPTTLTVAYDAPSRNYTISYEGRTQTFRPSDRDAALSSAAATAYARTENGVSDALTLTNPGTSGALRYQYVGGGIWQRASQSASATSGAAAAFAYGLPTGASAVPRSGFGQYDADVVGLYADPGGLLALAGQGIFSIDFGGARALFEGIVTRFAANGTAFGTFPLIANAQIGSGSGFSGELRLGQSGTQLSGTIAGSFFGPAAEEIGASFEADGRPGEGATGFILGRRSTLSTETLDTLATDRAFSLLATGTGYRIRDGIPGLTSIPPQDPTPVSIVVDRQDATYTTGFGTFGPTARVAADSNARFTTYQLASPDLTRQLRVYTPGAGNDELVLNYASFGVMTTIRRFADSAQDEQYWFAYGLRTPAEQLPRIGTGSYAGVLYGFGVSQAAGDIYDMTGTSAFTVDFAAAQLSGSFDPVLRSRVNGAVTNLGTFLISPRTFARDAFAVETSIVRAGSTTSLGTFRGSFFGPAADEIAGTVAFTTPAGDGPLIEIDGVAAARRR